jgi:hypothetical protein
MLLYWSDPWIVEIANTCCCIGPTRGLSAVDQRAWINRTSREPDPIDFKKTSCWQNHSSLNAVESLAENYHEKVVCPLLT